MRLRDPACDPFGASRQGRGLRRDILARYRPAHVARRLYPQPAPLGSAPRGDDTPSDDDERSGDETASVHVSVEIPASASAILDVVDEIPPGAVRIYGDVAELTGTGARYAGWVLSKYGHLVPWWRVVNASGLLPAALQANAAARWREEGTPVRGDGSVDLPRARLPHL